jgi:hypothetical protein
MINISQKESSQFAKDYMESVLENAAEFLRNNVSPDDVFSYDDLKEWAKNNGFVLEE